MERDFGPALAPVGPPVLAVFGLGVSYDGLPVLCDVTFGVGAGELVAVIGPNGAGKSTLFKAIIGAVAHTGQVDIDGSHCRHRRERTAIAYIPQRADFDLDFPVTVEQVVLSGRRWFQRFGRRPAAHDRDMTRSCMASVGVDVLAGRRLGSLSGGQSSECSSPGRWLRRPGSSSSTSPSVASTSHGPRNSWTCSQHCVGIGVRHCSSPRTIWRSPAVDSLGVWPSTVGS